MIIIVWAAPLDAIESEHVKSPATPPSVLSEIIREQRRRIRELEGTTLRESTH